MTPRFAAACPEFDVNVRVLSRGRIGRRKLCGSRVAAISPMPNSPKSRQSTCFLESPHHVGTLAA